jgi:predicted transcriptional regulator
MIELVKQGKQKEARDFFSTQKGALILNEYNDLQEEYANYSD